MNPLEVERRTRHWLQVMVVGENLCPFAAQPLHSGLIRIAVCEAADDDGIYRAFLAEVQRLLDSAEGDLETTLLVCPQGLQDFAHYLDMLAALEHALAELRLEGVLQIASFHPDYVFADSETDDPANYTNRAPYPLFHLIRESSISRVLQGVERPERIPQRNQQHMRALGLQRIRQLLAGAGGAAPDRD